MSNKIRGFPPVPPGCHRFPSPPGTSPATQTSAQGKAGGWVFIVGWPLLGSKPAPDPRAAPPIRRLRTKIQPIGCGNPAQPIPQFPRGAHRERAGCWRITLTCLEADRLSHLLLIWTKEFKNESSTKI